MKSLLRVSLLAALLASVPYLSAAERWSTDETALQMGIRSWLSFQSSGPKAGASTSMEKALYITAPTTPATAAHHYRSARPENVSVTMQGNQATTSFLLPSTQVVLQWERKGGLWKIAQETMTPVANAAEQVALSGSSAR